MFRKTICSILSVAMLSATAFTGCGNNDSSSTSGAASSSESASQADAVKSSESESLDIVCTIYPEYDWVNQILGSKAKSANVTYLLDNGVDLHSYQPTVDDIMSISNADMFVYVGGESDEWAEDALAEAQNKDMKVINLMDVLGDSAKVEELKEGMQEEEHEHDHDEAHEEEHEDDEEHEDEENHEDEEEHEHEHEEGEEEYDEHVWLSLKNAKTLCTEIENQLEAIDPANAEEYKSNLADYLSKLDTLDGKFTSLTGSASNKTLVFGDRFPFRYFVDDYGLDYFAAFIGCSAESEASFETITFLANKIDELNCDTVFTIEKSDKKIAETIINNSKKGGQKIAELNSIQSVSKDDINNDVTYLSLMEGNYNVLSDYFKG